MSSDEDEAVEVVLALGGGAARGLAHIGIIRVLEAEGLKIRGVAGTSIGSIVGGLHCAGRLDAYETYMRGLDARTFLRLLDPVMPRAGLLGGARVMKQLQEIAGAVAIEDLPIPFSAVATDLHSGEEVRLRSGPMVDAMRASWAIPGIFAPVKLGDRWLVDGGVSMPVPVAAARELVPGLPVIAVNLNNTEYHFQGEVVDLLESSEDERELGRIERLFQRMRGHRPKDQPDDEYVPGMVSSVSDSVTHLEHKITRFQLAADPPDLLLEPAVFGIGLFDFHRAEAVIGAGAHCAQRAVTEGRIKELAAKARRRGRLPRWLRERP